MRIIASVEDPAVIGKILAHLEHRMQVREVPANAAAANRPRGPPGQGEFQRVPCHAFTPVAGGFSQTQLGSTLSRLDKAPLSSGTYFVRITIDGQTADVPFAVK